MKINYLVKFYTRQNNIGTNLYRRDRYDNDLLSPWNLSKKQFWDNDTWWLTNFVTSCY